MRKFYIAHIHSVKKRKGGYRICIYVPKEKQKSERYELYMSEPNQWDWQGSGTYWIEISKERIERICIKERIRFKRKLVGRKLVLLKDENDKDNLEVQIAVIPQKVTVDDELSFYPFMYDEKGNHIELEFF